TKKNPKHDKLSWDIHFWLGAESSKDEQGVAAYKTVELDSHLGGAPVQYREVQNHESQLFLSYFKKGITYLSGGIDSGFRKVEKGVYQKRLLHVKGKRNVRVTQVKCDITSLNTGDVFVLDCGEQIFVWIGPKSRGTERLKGMEVGKRIRDEERSGKATITIIDKKWDSDVEFFKYFDSHGTIRSEDSEVDDDVFENQKGLLQLYRVCDAQGKIEMTEVCGRPLRREMLDSNDCFILDTGTSGIFVWIGRKCSVNERKCGWKLALEFLEKKNYPEWTQVTRVVGHGETPLFKQYFEGWTETQAIIGKSRAYSIGSIARANRAKFDATILHKHQPFKEKEQLPDDGTGLITIWHVFDKKLNSVPSEEYGTFYSGACYIILYVCCGAGGDGTQMLYFWQGNKSSKEDIAACVVMVQAIDIKEVNGKAVQVRITQYQEPEHFLRIFHGKLIVLKGDGRKQDDFHSKTMLFHVRGYSEFNTRAFQTGEHVGRVDFVLELNVAYATFHSVEKRYVFESHEG
ncbi:advillin-like, partial [Argonauta hians]